MVVVKDARKNTGSIVQQLAMMGHFGVNMGLCLVQAYVTMFYASTSG